MTIPEDVKTAAYALVDKMKAEDHGFDLHAYDFAVAAMWAERQRCADVAAKWAADDLQNGETRLSASYIRREILSATT